MVKCARQKNTRSHIPNKMALIKNLLGIMCLFWISGLLSVGFASSVGNVEDVIPKDAILFDKTPAAIVKLMEKDLEFRIQRPNFTKKIVACLDEVNDFVKKNPNIFTHLDMDVGSEIVDLVNPKKDVLYLAVSRERVEQANEQDRSLLERYNILVKKLHDKIVGSAGRHTFHQMMHRELNILDQYEKAYLYKKVLARYPEFKNHDPRAVILYGLLLKNWGNNMRDYDL